MQGATSSEEQHSSARRFETASKPAVPRESHRHNALSIPIAAAAAISHVELTLKRTRNATLPKAIKTVRGSINEARPKCHVTAAIRPGENPAETSIK